MKAAKEHLRDGDGTCAEWFSEPEEGGEDGAVPANTGYQSVLQRTPPSISMLSLEQGKVNHLERNLELVEMQSTQNC